MNVLNGDGCNNNVNLFTFSRRNKDKFSISNANVDRNHCQQDMSKRSSELVQNWTLSIVSHSYTSNKTVAKYRHNVLLGMLWHVSNNPRIGYARRVMRVKKDDLSLEGCRHGTDANMCKVSYMRVKSFRKIIRKGLLGNVRVFQVVVKEGSDGSG